MKNLTAFIFLGFAILLNIIFTGCDKLDGGYSTNPSHRISFSVDTLSFDTIFSSVGSTTRQFMIYNKNSEPLNIESILLASGGDTGFRINVDGRKGDRFENIEVREQDSLFVFVEVTVDPNGKNQPLLVQDSILFSYNGNRQSVKLEAYGQDVYLYKGGFLFDSDTYLPADKPYLIYDSITVAPEVTVEIEKGATFYMHDKAKVLVQGTLSAEGTLNEPITFRGDRLDYILDDLLPYDRTPGQWGGFFFGKESFENKMNHVIIRNGTSGLAFQESTPEQIKLTINNSQITNMDGDLFTAVNCHIEAANTEFSNATGGVMALFGGKYQFTHCTLANYMTLKQRVITVPCLFIAGEVTINKKTTYYPVEQAYFDNCIIDGNFSAGSTPLSGEIGLSPSKAGNTPTTPFNYRFNHCIIKTKGNNNDQFIDIIFAQSPLYRMTGDKKDKYTFDFRLSEGSVGRGKADVEISKNYPLDRYEIDRLKSSDGPDIGAYEYVPEAKE